MLKEVKTRHHPTPLIHDSNKIRLENCEKNSYQDQENLKQNLVTEDILEASSQC